MAVGVGEVRRGRRRRRGTAPRPRSSPAGPGPRPGSGSRPPADRAPTRPPPRDQHPDGIPTAAATWVAETSFTAPLVASGRAAAAGDAGAEGRAHPEHDGQDQRPGAGDAAAARCQGAAGRGDEGVAAPRTALLTPARQTPGGPVRGPGQHQQPGRHQRSQRRPARAHSDDGHQHGEQGAGTPRCGGCGRPPSWRAAGTSPAGRRPAPAVPSRGGPVGPGAAAAGGATGPERDRSRRGGVRLGRRRDEPPGRARHRTGCGATAGTATVAAPPRANRSSAASTSGAPGRRRGVGRQRRDEQRPQPRRRRRSGRARPRRTRSRTTSHRAAAERRPTAGGERQRRRPAPPVGRRRHRPSPRPARATGSPAYPSPGRSWSAARRRRRGRCRSR